MFSISILLASIALLILGFALLAKGKIYPPGPRPLPVVGNLLQMPNEQEREWLVFSRWAEKYGPILHIQVLTQHILILNSLKAASDLLDKRSAYYSSRPHMVMAGDLVGFSRWLGLMPYENPRFSRMRRLLHKELTGLAMMKYAPTHEQEAYVLLKNIIDDPDNLVHSIQYYAGSVILKVSYGYQVQPKNDPYIEAVGTAMSVFSATSQPGAWTVDVIPWLRYMPSWVPGGGFKRLAAKWRQTHTDATESPYRWAKASQDFPTLIRPNFVSTVLDDIGANMSEEEEQTLVWAAGSLCGGGADTTVSSISSFFLAMALHPQVQQRAQAEIDSVIGNKRLPRLTDRAALPYVEGILLEMLRWNPVANLGVPHLLTRDDEYEGYFIPKDTIVMANIWSILHDPETFPDPEAFNPERFLDDKRARDVVKAAFGFGRRVCPGMNFAETSMFMALSTALAVCDISDARDEAGNPVPVDVAYGKGTVSHPKPFTCTIDYRSDEAQGLLQGC